MATFDQQQHPITPPPELVEQWINEPGGLSAVHVATQAARWIQAARWGADQELEACCEWLREARNHGFGYDMGRILADNLRAARRPKPPSLAEEALTALDQADEGLSESEWQQRSDTIRRALERLQKLENND